MPGQPSGEPHCLVAQEGHTLVVTMNRPEVRNALSAQMMDLMRDAWDRVNDDPEIRVAILTGAGGDFCAGADLKAMSSNSPSDRFESGEFDPSVIKSLLKGYRVTKPLIAAVEGPAIAGGTEILQATDIRVAGESARGSGSPSRGGGSTRSAAPRSASLDSCPTPSPRTCCSPAGTSRRPRPRRSG